MRSSQQHTNGHGATAERREPQVLPAAALNSASALVIDPGTLAQLVSAASLRPLLVDAVTVARLLSVSPSTLARMVDRGDFPPGELMPGSKRVVKEDAVSGRIKEWGGLVRWRLADVERWVAEQWAEERADPHT